MINNTKGIVGGNFTITKLLNVRFRSIGPQTPTAPLWPLLCSMQYTQDIHFSPLAIDLINQNKMRVNNQFPVTNGAIVIHTQRLKSDPGGNLLS